jgi:uncharacterized protein (DUF1499 family)
MTSLLFRLLVTLLAPVLLLGMGYPPASLLHLEGPVPADLGVHGGSLSPCVTPAHCSRASWPVSDPAAALQRLLPVVLALDGVDIVETGDNYADPTAGVVQARSVSRLGDSDLGVNRRRLKILEQALSSSGT